MKKNYISRFILLVVLICGINFGVQAQCNCAWQYRMPIVISNSGTGAVTDLQVPVTVNTGALVSVGKMLASGNDILFADAACNNLPYWIESGMNTGATKIWVRVNTIAAATTTTIYMYYGNTSASAASSGTATFLFFDDFNGSSINTAMWDTSYTAGTVTVSGGTAAFSTSGGGHMLLLSVNSYPAPYYSEMNVTAISGQWPNIAQGDTGSYNAVGGATMFTDGSTTMYMSNTHTSAGLTGYSGVVSTSATLGADVGIWSFVRDNASGMTFGAWPGGFLFATSVDVVPAVGNQSTALGLLKSGAGTLSVDWARGRKFYSDTTSQTPGAEQVNIPLTVTGSVLVCPGHTATLSDATAGGAWSSSNTGVATVSGGVVTGASGGTASISYTMPSGCAATALATVYAAPSPAITVTGNTLGTTTPFSTYQWSIGGTPITGATDATYTFSLSGFYTVTVTDANGCTATSGAAIVNVGVKNINAGSSDIQVYPNPAQREITITSAGGISAVSISNVMGQNVFTSHYSDNTVVVSTEQLPDGVYFVRVNSVSVYRIVKAH